MRKQIFALFLIISTLYKAQNFDSLVRASIKIDNDTEKVNLFYTQGFKARASAPQFAYNCAKQAEFFAGQSGSKKHEAKAHILMGILFYRKGDLKKALEHHQKALDIRQQINDEAGIALSENNLANIYTDLGKNELAELSYMHALQINHKLGNEKQTGNCYLNIGVLKMAENKYEESEKYFLSAYKISKATMDYELESMCLNNLAVINMQNKSYESAIGNCLDALKVKEIMGNEMEKTDSYINLSKSYLELKDEVNCEYYFKKADSLCNVFDYLEAKCHLMLLRSEISEAKKDAATALLYYKKYINLKDSISKETKSIELDNGFQEEKISSANQSHHFSFPYLILLSISVICIFIIFIIYKNKR